MWLDLTQTDFMSIDQAERLTVEGSTFEGWRFPTRAEVAQMMANAFPSQASRFQTQNSWGGTNTTTDNEADRFRALLGNTYGYSSDDYTAGISKDSSSSSFISGVYDRRDDDYVTLYSNHSYGYGHLHRDSKYGVYLVSDGGITQSSRQDPSINANNAAAPINSVSAPTLLGLMGLGFFGFTARRRSYTPR
jgi:hypothetical protein